VRFILFREGKAGDHFEINTGFGGNGFFNSDFHCGGVCYAVATPVTGYKPIRDVIRERF